MPETEYCYALIPYAGHILLRDGFEASVALVLIILSTLVLGVTLTLVIFSGL